MISRTSVQPPRRPAMLGLLAVLFFTCGAHSEDAPSFKEAMPPDRPANDIWVQVEKDKKGNIPIRADFESYSQTIACLLSKDRPPEEEGYHFTVPFSVDTAGSYEIWLACSAIGAGYSSPVRYYLDGEEIKAPKNPERGKSQWSLSNAVSWNKLDKVKLDTGKHSLKFVIHEKRPMDDYYAFMLDVVAFVRTDKPN